MMNYLHFCGSDWSLGPEDVTSELLADLLDCGAPGEAAPAVNHVMQIYIVTGNPEDCRDFLRVYGAWSEEELADHSANLGRLVWLTGGSLVEHERAYFSHL